MYKKGMKKFKAFARKRWHSIPIGAMAIALVASMAISGVAYAAFSVFTGSGTATVVESITVTGSTPTDGTWTQETGTWAFDIYPAQTKTLTLKITNAGVPLPLTIGIADAVDLTETIKVWDGSAYIDYNTSYTVSGTGYVQFTVTADADADLGAKTFTITISR